ncbi:hypothetical protein CHS0354_009288 [Potamilus streckersoni]|uniref:PH domain-containing protein n=1 Tax=Potamilus streckersoni TaxID=2493646 RepID=A0AAE0T6R1_9BIVA|nr:hypothetical protein CHS0354_009288 [Potamilus streckersoni]
METVRPQLRGRKFHEGWIEHKDSQRNGWNKYWLVLKRFEKLILFIFGDEHTSPESQVGLLTLDSNTEFRVREGDARNGYKFDIYTTSRRNRFKSKMFHEREIWRAYIVGLVKGTLPDDLDLTEAQIQMIESDIDYHKMGHRESNVSMTDSGFGMDEGSGRISMFYNGSIGSGGSSTVGGGPTMTHRFYRDPRQSGTPSWFVSGCSRDFAEKILTNARKFGMGNTLLRESTTHMSTGSYVITKRVDHAGGCEFDHYEVARVAEGYKLNVENDHQPMKCLSEVMDYFIQTAGPATKLLNSNNLQTLGLDTPDYQRMIPRSQPLEKSSQSSGPIEPPAVASGYKTYSGRNTTSMRELAYRADVADELDNLNRMIDGFETPSNAYYNDPDLFTKAKEQQKEKDRAKNSISSPPPPPPCNPKDRHLSNPDVPYQPAPPIPRQMDQAVPPPPPPISSLEKLKPTTSSTSESIRKSQLLIAVSEKPPIQEELKNAVMKRAAIITDESKSQEPTVPSTVTSQRLQQTTISPQIYGQEQRLNPGKAQSQGQSKDPVGSGVETDLPHSFASIRRKFDAPKPAITDQTFKSKKATSSASSVHTPHCKDQGRRASEPVIPGRKVAPDYINMKTEIEPVDPAFLNRLNQIMLTPQRETARSSIPHQSSYPGAGNEDDWYEPIPADEVFYLNEKYNN